MAEPAAGYNPTFPWTNERPTASVMVEPAKTPKLAADPRSTISCAWMDDGKETIARATIGYEASRFQRGSLTLENGAQVKTLMDGFLKKVVEMDWLIASFNTIHQNLARWGDHPMLRAALFMTPTDSPFSNLGRAVR
jgi:hypothetical protein